MEAAQAQANGGLLKIWGFIPWYEKYSTEVGGNHIPVLGEWESTWLFSQYGGYLQGGGGDVYGVAMANVSVHKFGPTPAARPMPAPPSEASLQAQGYLSEEGEVVSLVGKGVTFDTGGISLKPGADMDEMKYDKSGACAVLGIARIVSELGLPVRLRGYVPLAENMPDGSAYRPGDIVRCYNGKTVEILNTDAEGRMMLADALALAVEEGAEVLLEYSTLTGGAVVALGLTAAALYTPDDELAGELLASAEAAGERLWRMPLWPEFVEAMKGVHGDLKNSGGRWGSANTAAAFLSQFVDGHPHWAHIDLAGPAYVGRDSDDPPGATGYGVATTLDWLSKRVGSPQAASRRAS